MTVKYIIESKYYNGDKYAEKLDDIDELIEALQVIRNFDNEYTADDERIDSKQISVTTEEA